MRRTLAVAIAGFATFINLYTPQAILPAIAGTFGAGPAQTGLAITATLLAVALVAPFAGAVSDRLGRKRLIVGACFILTVPALLIALSPNLAVLIGLRFVQGLLFPFIFTVTVAYIGDECAGAEAVRATGSYALGTIFGGFFGRFAAGIATDLAGWQGGFAFIGGLTLLCAISIALLLPRERRFRPVTVGAAVWRGHFGNARLLATCLIGACMLFSMVSAFTYANFRLADAPFGLTPGQLGAVFTVYLLGLVTNPVATRLVLRFGRRATLMMCVGFSLCGIALTPLPSLPAIVAGMALLCGGMFVVQTLSLGFIAAKVTQAKSTAVGMYVTAYYVGGAAGGILPAPIWRLWGWPGVAGLLVVVACAIMALAHRAWRE